MAKVITQKAGDGDGDENDRDSRPTAAPAHLVPLEVLQERRRATGIIGIVIDSALAVIQTEDTPAARLLAKLFTEAQGAIRSGASVNSFALAHVPPAPK